MNRALLFHTAWVFIGIALIGYGLWRIDPRWAAVVVGGLIYLRTTRWT